MTNRASPKACIQCMSDRCQYCTSTAKRWKIGKKLAYRAQVAHPNGKCHSREKYLPIESSRDTKE